MSRFELHILPTGLWEQYDKVVDQALLRRYLGLVDSELSTDTFGNLGLLGQY